MLEIWQKIQIISDLTLRSVIELDEQSLPDEIIYIAGQALGETLDPAIDSDRQKVLAAAREGNGLFFQFLNQKAGELEFGIRDFVHQCGENGPLQARVRGKQGNFILSICQSDTNSELCANDHAIPINIRAEKSKK